MLRYNRKNKNLKIPVGIGTNNNVDSSLLFNVSDGDATAGDLVAGKTAYSAEGFIVGTLDVETEKQNSYNEGYSAGEQDGYVSGEADGYADGYSEGKEDGIEEILTEQSDANITPGSVLEGYIGYGANNERIVGTNVGGFDFGEIGYTEEENNELNSQLKEPLEYTKSLMPVTPSVSLNRKFNKDKNLVYAPYIDTSITTNMSYMFYECTNLQYVPQYDYSNVTTVEQMFAYAGGPKEIDFSFDNNIRNFNQVMSYNTGTEKLVINAANVTNSLYGLAYESKIKHLEVFNIPNTVTDLRSMFHNCKNLEYVRLSGDTSNVSAITSQYDFCFQSNRNLHTVILDIDTHFLRNCNVMFNFCSSLTTIPLFNTSNVTNMSSMFNACSSLTTIPLFNTSNVTNMSSMFEYCEALTTVPLFNTSNVTEIGGMFYYCPKLESLPLFDFQNVIAINNTYNDFLYSCNSLTDVAGFKDLGKSFTGSSAILHNLILTNCPLLTRQSLLNIFNNLYDMNLTSVTDAKITIPLSLKNLLSPEDIAIATNKGWIIQ